MKLTFLMQATRSDRKHRKICEHCPGHSLIVQSLTLYVMLRHSGRWTAPNWRPKISFSLSWKVLMKPGLVCHMRVYIPIGLGRLYFTGIALAIKILSQKEDAPHCKKLSLTKYTASTLSLQEACLPIYIHHSMGLFISMSYLPHPERFVGYRKVTKKKSNLTVPDPASYQ